MPDIDTSVPPGRVQVEPEFFLKRYRDIADRARDSDEAKAAWEAGRLGYEAGKKGAPLDTNPYAPGSETHQRWAAEWRDGAADQPHSHGSKIIEPKDHQERFPEDDDGEELP